MKTTTNQPEYGNWVPKKLVVLLWVLTGLAALLLAANLIWWKNTVLTVIFAVALVLVLFYAVMMQMMHQSFSFTGGKLMGKIHDYLLQHLDWDGHGTLLDIGCGSGALTIKAARKYPDAKALGLDYWGITWDYAKEQCQKNAELEHVKNIEFMKGDASGLPFADGSIDAAVSNFVFHEVRTVPDKRSLVREALRVVRPGGSFAFHDLFDSPRLYGNMEEFIEELKKEGVTEIHYEPRTENLPIVPGHIKLMFNKLGLLYGKK